MAVVLVLVGEVPSSGVQRGEVSPLCPAMMLPERREDVRFGPGGRVSLHPGLVQRRNPFGHGLERARVFALKLTVALVRVRRLERCITLLLLRRRARPLVPLFEREAVPVRGQSWVRREAHWLTLPVTHTGAACPPAGAEEVLQSCDTDSGLLASVADSLVRGRHDLKSRRSKYLEHFMSS